MPSKAASASSSSVVEPRPIKKHSSPQSTTSSTAQPDTVQQPSHQRPVERMQQQPHQEQLQQQQQELLPAARRVLVDQRQKWQRISEWISRDSSEAAAVGSHKAGSSSNADNSFASQHKAGTAAQGHAGPQIATAAPPEEDGQGMVSVTELRYSLDTAVMELAAARHKTAAADAATPPSSTVSGQLVCQRSALFILFNTDGLLLLLSFKLSRATTESTSSKLLCCCLLLSIR